MRNLRFQVLNFALLVATSLCLAGSMAVASGRVYILTIAGPIAGGGHVAKAKPREIKLFSGAGLRSLRWNHWGGRIASASGYEFVTDKSTVPYIVSKNAVKVRATDRRLCGKIRVYRKLRVHFTKGVPPGMWRDATFSMSCPD